MNDNVFSIDLGKQFPKNQVALSVNLVTIFCSRMLILLEKRQIEASGRRAGSEIAANGATDASANGGPDVRQTKARMFRQTAGDHLETIIKGDNYSDTSLIFKTSVDQIKDFIKGKLELKVIFFSFHPLFGHQQLEAKVPQ